MHTFRFAAALAALVIVEAAPAVAQEAILQVDRENWPTELTQRPLTLAQGMFEVWLPVNVNLSEGADGEPVFLNPSLMFGVTDRWTIGVRHFRGVCLSDEDAGCPEVYDDVSFDSVFSLGRSGGLDLGVGLALNLAPLVDETTFAGEGRLILRAGGGSVAFTLAPTLNFGLNDRESNAKRYPIAMNLGTYNALLPQDVIPNKEWLLVPATLQLQLGPTFAVAASASVNGPIDPEVGDYGDYWTVPVGVAAVLTPLPALDLGAAFTFPRLLGEDEDADERFLSVFLAFRR
jgi:hypothetical protein